MLFFCRCLLFLFLFPFLICGEESLSLSFDLLYWKATEKSLVLTNGKSALFFTDDFTKQKVLHPDFQWSFGYRLGGAFLPDGYPFGIALDWTHYQTTISQHRKTNSNDLTNVNGQEGMFPIWALAPDIIAGDYVTEAELDGRLKLDFLDLDVKYCFSCDPFEVTSSMGLRGAGIRQNGEIRYRGGIFLTAILEGGVSLEGEDRVHLKNHFWGIGPRFGVKPELNIGYGFSAYGDASISALLGFVSLRQKETYLDNSRFSKTKHSCRLRWIADLALGISWKSFFWEKRCEIAWKLGWEYHLLFHQLDLQGDSFGLVSKNRNLAVQGVVLSGQVDY